MKEPKIESGLPVPTKASFREGTTFEGGDAHSPGVDTPEKEYNTVTRHDPKYLELERDNETLRLRLENAELRAKLAEAKVTGVGAPSASVNLARPLPTKDEIPAGVPPMPKADPAAGDKTPEVVRWMKKYMPERYAIQYKGRKTVLDDLRRSNPNADEEGALSREEAREARAPDFKPCKGEEGLDCSARTFTV